MIREQTKKTAWFISAGIGLAVCFTWVFLRSAGSQVKHSPSEVHRLLTQNSNWLNTSRPLTPKDLKGRIILLDFWTFCCINCMHVIPDLHALEKEFGAQLTVIGVHSAKFENEKEAGNIRAAILRYEIEHPVVNDADFNIWRGLGVTSWPTFVLVNPTGQIEHGYAGEGNYSAIRNDILALTKEYQGKLNTDPLPMALEKNKEEPSVLRFPSKLAYDPSTQTLFISDSNHHRIVASSLEGKVLYAIGEGQAGKRDGQFETAQFFRPQGILYRNNQIFVADTENHLIRQVDLSSKTVSTLAGTGIQGFEREPKKSPALQTPLSSPWDLAPMPGEDDEILIAMAGLHQLWSLNLQKKTLNLVAGNGREAIDDGELPYNSLSQPSGLSTVQNRAYFVDSETSSLRVFEKGKLTTLIGTGLFDFGFKDGPQGQGLLQHPLGVWADSSGVYLADSYNHSIRKYDAKNGRIETIAGSGKRGLKNGDLKSAQFFEPSGLIRIQDTLFVADTNNHQIRTIDLKKKEVGTLALSLPEAETSGQKTPASFLPQLKKTSNIDVAAETPIFIQIRLNAGWEINHQAPSKVTLFEKVDSGFVFIKDWKRPDLASLKIEIPRLKTGREYRIQGTFYFCKKEAGSLCMIESRDFLIHPSPSGKASQKVEIDLRRN